MTTKGLMGCSSRRLFMSGSSSSGQSSSLIIVSELRYDTRSTKRGRAGGDTFGACA